MCGGQCASFDDNLLLEGYSGGSFGSRCSVEVFFSVFYSCLRELPRGHEEL